MTEDVDMRDAVQRAFHAISGLYSDKKLQDLLLEEVLLRQGEWEVTLGFTSPYDPQTPGVLDTVLAQPGTRPRTKPRLYKRVIIDAHTGEVKGMLDGRIDEG